jgi:hypothetical protein
VEKSGLKPETTPEIQQLFEMKEKFVDMKLGQDWEKMLKCKIEEISSKFN